MRGHQRGKHQHWNEFRKAQAEEERCKEVCGKTKQPGKKVQLQQDIIFPAFKLPSAGHPLRRFCPAASKCETRDSRPTQQKKASWRFQALFRITDRGGEDLSGDLSVPAKDFCSHIYMPQLVLPNAKPMGVTGHHTPPQVPPKSGAGKLKPRAHNFTGSLENSPQGGREQNTPRDGTAPDCRSCEEPLKFASLKETKRTIYWS